MAAEGAPPPKAKSIKVKAIKGKKEGAKIFAGPQYVTIVTGLMYGYAFTPGNPSWIGLGFGAFCLVMITLVTAGIVFTSQDEEEPLIWCASLGGIPMILLNIALTKNVPWNFWFTTLIWIVTMMGGASLGMLMLGR